LKDVTKYMTNNNTNQAVLRELHGAIAEIAEPDGFLSVTSMNQLIHSKTFTVNDRHISPLFFNVFPLLEKMNQ